MSQTCNAVRNLTAELQAVQVEEANSILESISPLFTPQEDAEDFDVLDQDLPVCPPCNIHEILAKPLFDVPAECPLECPICYDSINMVNIVVTRCGHSFHASCLMMSTMTLDNCPMCRVQLLPDVPESDDEDSDYDSDEEESIAGDDDSVPDNRVTLEQCAAKLTNMGYTNIDLLRLLLGHKGYFPPTSNLERFDSTFIHQLDDDIEGILTKEIPLASVDTRSYARVVANGN